MLLKPASDFHIVYGDGHNAVTHSEIVRSTNGFAIGLAIISMLSAIQMCSHLILVLLHWVGMVQIPSSKYPQFHKSVFLVGVSMFFISRLIMIAWTLNTVLDIKGIMFDLQTYWSLWLVVVMITFKGLTSMAALKLANADILHVKNESASDALEYPDVFVVMSIFREQTSTLMETVDSIVESNYPKNKIRLVLVFDENSEGLEYILFLNRLNLFDSVLKYKYGETEYHGVRIIVGKFVHTGKQSSQRYGVELIRRVYGTDHDISSDPILIFCDSDIIFDENTLLNGSMKLYNDQRLVGVVGTKSVRPFNGVLGMIETMDCLEKELFEFPIQKMYDCFYDLPGQIILIRFAAFREVELRYFANVDMRSSIATYNRTKFADHLLLQNLIIENYGGRLCYSPSVKVFCQSASCWADYIDDQRRHYLGLLATTVGLLGSRKLFTEVKRVYWLNSWNLSTRASQMTVFSLLITCLFSGAYSMSQLILLLLPIFSRCIAFAFFSIKLGRPILAIAYPIYTLILKSILDFVVLIYSLVSWNVQIWGGYRTRMVSVKEKSLKSPGFEHLFQKVKQMSLNKDNDDDELLEKAASKKTLKHQFIAYSRYQDKFSYQKPENTEHVSVDLEMQKTTSFGTEVFDAINALDKESSLADDQLKLSVTKLL